MKEHEGTHLGLRYWPITVLLLAITVILLLASLGRMSARIASLEQTITLITNTQLAQGRLLERQIASDLRLLVIVGKYSGTMTKQEASDLLTRADEITVRVDAEDAKK